MDQYKNKITAFYNRHHRLPGYQEMMEMTGFKSKNAVYKLINKMVETGFVSKDDKGRLTPGKMFNEIPLLGLVEAGIPTMIDDELTDTINLDEYLIEHREESFLLEVKGDSMIEEGIREGDLVVAEKRNRAKEGDIVIARIDGGWTMKFLRKKDGKNYLEPANKNYKPIFPKEDLEIGAVVTGVIRKY
jgi:repressor LexA